MATLLQDFRHQGYRMTMNSDWLLEVSTPDGPFALLGAGTMDFAEHLFSQLRQLFLGDPKSALDKIVADAKAMRKPPH